MPEEMKFNFNVPLDFFEKAGAEDGKKRRIGGLASLETKDRQGEILLQSGLDFSQFHKTGWFNKNHSSDEADILGYPDVPAQYVAKGSTLPNGKTAPANGHWVEGYLLDTKKADEIWETGNALQKTPRRLGFSVEGKILKRIGSANKIVAKALVREVAITKCPVNTGAEMEILAKSLQEIENSEPDDMDKALSMGTPASPGDAPVGPQTGDGAGQVLTPESLECDVKPNVEQKKKKKKAKKIKKSLTDDEARAWLKARLPHANSSQIGRVIEMAKTLKRNGDI